MAEKIYTIEEAHEYLGISRATFFIRVREFGIKPIGYNPALKRQKSPKYRESDLNRIKQGLFRAA